MRRIGNMGAAAALLAMTTAFAAPHHMGRTRYPKGHKPSGGIANIYHSNEREIARRLRPQARNLERQRARAADCFGCQIEGVERLSRRGRYIRESA